MNPWTQLSIDYANQKSYLDDLFQVYPTIPDGIRELNGNLWKDVEKAFGEKDNTALLKNLVKLDLFPIKDSYIAYLRRDRTALERNPATAARLSGRLYEMGLETIYARCSEPISTATLNAIFIYSEKTFSFVRKQSLRKVLRILGSREKIGSNPCGVSFCL